eukprot:g2394.t1
MAQRNSTISFRSSNSSTHTSSNSSSSSSSRDHTKAFVEEVLFVMKEFEITDTEEAIEETLSQAKERNDASSKVGNGNAKVTNEMGEIPFSLMHVDLEEVKREISRRRGHEDGTKTKEEEEPASCSLGTTVDMPAPLLDLARTLKNPKDPLGKRMRSLFYLRSVGGPTAVSAIIFVLLDKKHNGSLIRHEAAFVLGQMEEKSALSALESVLRDVSDDAMTRHEAAEAIGAIGLKATLEILREFTNDASNEVADTCRLAIDRICWQVAKNEEGHNVSAFNSVDPAPPLFGLSIVELESTLNDPERPLFERYGALFALRDLNTNASATIIARVLETDVSSALLRHEIAFVLGQLENPIATRALKRALARSSESVMVRHEAAEALGAIATDECVELLRRHQKDDCVAVAESALVALDVVNYWDEGDGSLMTKAQAAAIFSEPIRCSCAATRGRVVSETGVGGDPALSQLISDRKALGTPDLYKPMVRNMRQFFGKSALKSYSDEEAAEDIKVVPNHMAVIMDGNRRYGKKTFGIGREIRGHKAGGETLHDFMDWCCKYGVQNLTVYAFSTENWKRPKSEVDGLMELFCQHCPRIKSHCLEKGYRAKVVSSDFEMLPEHVQKKFRELEKATEYCKNLSLNICVSYGGRSEIVRAVRKMAQRAADGAVVPKHIQERDFNHLMLTQGTPDPELVIRTSGECRLSNFLLWQVAYSEMIFVNKHWPELTEEDFVGILHQYNNRKRRFGT